MIEIVSINAAIAPRNLILNGETVPTGFFKEPLVGVQSIGKLGLETDTVVHTNVHGGFDQALYLYSQEDYDWWEGQLERDLRPGMFGENLTLKGLDLSTLKVGDQLRFGNVLLEVTGPRIPCAGFAKRMDDPTMVKKFAKAARPGVYTRVIVEGEVAAGDEGEFMPTKSNYVGIRDVFVQWHSKEHDQTIVKKALESPISDLQINTVRKWLKK